MVKVSYHQKPYRRSMMQLWGADVIPSPSDQTNAGRAVLAEDPESLGSLGIAISEAVEDAVTHPGSKYALGSVTNHVLLHQTIIGEEAILQVPGRRRLPRRRHRLRRRRLELRRHRLPLPAREPRRQDEDAPSRRRADRLPVAHQGQVRLRLRRRGADHAAVQDVHAGPRLHAGRHPRRRPALPRHGAAHQPRLRPRADGRRGRAADEGLRGGAALRADGGHRAGAGERARHPASPSTRPWRPRRRARAGTSCSTSPATASSTSAPTTPTSAASSRTTTIPRRRSPRRSPSCRRSEGPLTTVQAADGSEGVEGGS